MARMHRRRLLCVDVPRRIGPTPIYLAIAALLLVSVAEVVVATWPDDSTASAQRPAESYAGPANQSFHESLRDVPVKGPPRGRMRWM